jgi:cytochrome c biogenesis protein CcdA
MPLDAVGEAIRAGGPAALAVAFLGGLVSSVNPCVMGSMFLLIGFVASYGGGGRKRLWVWALAFALGTTVVFTGLGLVAAQAGTLLGLVSRRWYILLAAITAWMGLQTLGVLPGPSWAAPGMSSRKGTVFALLLGALAGVILSPCATPVLVAVLSLAATMPRARAAALLFSYGVGRGVPLVIIGFSSEFISQALARPRVRAWTDMGRSILGFGILGLAAYFLYLGV